MLHSYLQRGALRHEHNGPVTTTPLTFGTAGLRGPMREGLDAMNVTTVSRATWAVAKVLKDRCPVSYTHLTLPTKA